MKIFSKITAAVLSAGIALSSAAFSGGSSETVSAAAGSCVAEYLDRGISAVNTGKGMLVSWRFLASDSDSTVFKLYRDNTLIYTSNAGKATCYLDASGSAGSKYRVDAEVGGKVVNSSNCSLISGTSYFDIPLSPPSSSHRPNDCSVGDVDGDGVYELFMKWDPTDSKDNSQKGKTSNVYIDCYSILTKKRLWRVDLGVNIRAGAHYTQFYVADFDLDGKAEMTCKTADGTKDGVGNYIGDKSKSYRDSSGFIITGPEYYTLFEGATGKALHTINYEPGRGDTTKWGKSSDKTNRVDRFWGMTAYLDGVHPCVVTGRGYYGRMTATAYKVENKKLVKMWAFDTGTSSSAAGYGDGNHNSMPADVDGDGKQEIITGSTCIDDNGKLLWCLNKGHGDAMHLGDFLPDRKGQELWICHEDKPYGVSLVDASNGKIIFHKDGGGDTGRCCADNVWSGNDGAEFWSTDSYDVYNGSGTALSCNRPGVNFLIYWDGDLERELLDGGNADDTAYAKIDDVTADGKIQRLLSTEGYYTCNTTKGTPCLSADIFGDWREELILRAADSKSVRIFCTPYTTDYRVTTLMHDIQYRTQVSAQNTAYNQPPHLSYYMSTKRGVPKRETVKVNGQTSPSTPVTPPAEVITPASFTNGSTWRFKNVNSGLYMQVDGAKAENGANIQQWGTSDSTIHDIWKLVDAGDGYYYIASAVGDGGTFVLDIAGRKTANGTNADLYTYNSGTNQQFMFTKNSDGSYKIRTRITNGKSAVEVADGSKNSGANVQQWEVNGANCQDWVMEAVSNPGCKMDTSVNYEFKNVNSGMVMDIVSGKMEDGTNVQQWGSNGYDCQKWTLQAFAGGGNYYYIRSVSDSNYVLRAYSSANGGNIAIAPYSGSDSAMLFKFSKNLDGSYCIMTRASKDACYVEVESAKKTSGANVQQWAPTNNDCQKWTAETHAAVTQAPATTTTTASTQATTAASTTAPPAATTAATSVNENGNIVNMDTDAVYIFKSVNSGHVISPADSKLSDGMNVQQMTANNKNYQKWILTKANYDYYYIRSYENPDYYLCADKSANIFLADGSAGQNSMMYFLFRSAGNGIYTIVSRTGTGSAADTKVLDVVNASKESGANIDIYAPNNGNNQKWTLVIETTSSAATTPAATTTTTSATSTTASASATAASTSSSTSAPTTTGTTAATTTAPVELPDPADLNKDGRIDLSDIVLLQKFLLNQPVEIPGNADINLDGKVNIFDLIVLKRTVLLR